jgi:transposase
MVYLVKKVIKNKVYLYLVESARVNGKVKRIWQKYLGPEDNLKLAAINLSKPPLVVIIYDFGLPVVLMQIVKKLDLIAIIDKVITKREQGLSVGQYITIAALNRCIKPVSKNKILGWFGTSYLQKFFPKVETYLDSMAYTNHFEYLNEINIEEIEKEINLKLKSEFNVDLSQLVYDATNFYTYIEPEDEDAIPQHGHSKENRSTLNLVGLALLCSQDGAIPLLYDVYPGNVQDAQEFKWQTPKIIDRIKAINQDPNSIILSFDKGNHSQDVFSEIDKAGLYFVVSIRPSMVKDCASIPAKDFRMVTLPNQKRIGIIEYAREFYGKSRRLLIVYNPEQAEWNGKNLTEKVKREIEEVRDFFQDRLNVKKWRSLDAVQKKIETIIPNKEHWKFINYSLSENNSINNLKIEINDKALKEHIETLGKSYIISNHPTKTAEDLVWLFRQQATIEKAFSYLKSPDLLRARPIFHRKDSSIQGHLFSCVLGLLLITLLVREVRKHYPEMTMRTIMELLTSINISEIKYDGHNKPIRKLTHISEEASKLVELFNLNSYI